MNAPTKIATLLRTASAELAADNAKAQEIAESRLSEVLRGYIDNPHGEYFYGGIHNLLKTIAAIVSDKSQRDGDDWALSADDIYDCASKVDRKYSEEI